MTDGNLDLAFLGRNKSSYEIVDMGAFVFLYFGGIKEILADRYPLRNTLSAPVWLNIEKRFGFANKLFTAVRDSAEMIFACQIIAVLAR